MIPPWHVPAAVLQDVPRHGQLGQGCGAGVHAVMALRGAQRCCCPTCAVAASSGSVGVGDRVGYCSSTLCCASSTGPAGWQCWRHGASCAGWVRALLGTWGRARGQFLCGRHQFEYMACSSFNYSNWLLEGPADACFVSEGEHEWLSCLMLHLWRRPCLHLAICHQPRGMSPVPTGTRLIRGALTHGCVPLCNPKELGGYRSWLGGESPAQPQAESGPGGDVPEPHRLKGALDHEAVASGWSCWYVSNVGTPAGQIQTDGASQHGWVHGWLLQHRSGRQDPGLSPRVRVCSENQVPKSLGSAPPTRATPGTSIPSPGAVGVLSGTMLHGPPSSSHHTRARCLGRSWRGQPQL